MDALVARLEAHEPVPTPEEVDEVRALMAGALRSLALSSTVLSSLIISMTRKVYTSGIDTLAVTLAGDGLAMLLVKPEFAAKLGKDGLVFVLSHEAYHLISAHLHADPLLRNNPNWELATEACVNRRVMRHLGVTSLPTVDGQPSGVDPDKVYDSYKAAMKKAGETFLSKDEFYSTDLTCLSELDRMPRPPRMKISCEHGAGSGSGDGDGSSGQPHLDQNEVDKLVGKALAAALHEAKANGNKAAANELLDLVDSNPQADKMWGDLGVGSLRGETTTTRKTDLWERWTADIVGSRLEEGQKLRYQKKIPWDPRVTGHGREPRKSGVVAIDASGSMPTVLLDKIAAIVQEHEELDIDWVSFDGSVWPFKPGEAFQGGGGTSFEIIDAYVADLDEEPDFVLVVTDGYAPRFTPRDPDAWIWLITPNGDAWPGDDPWRMACRQIDLF